MTVESIVAIASDTPSTVTMRPALGALADAEGAFMALLTDDQRRAHFALDDLEQEGLAEMVQIAIREVVRHIGPGLESDAVSRIFLHVLTQAHDDIGRCCAS